MHIVGVRTDLDRDARNFLEGISERRGRRFGCSGEKYLEHEYQSVIGSQ